MPAHDLPGQEARNAAHNEKPKPPIHDETPSIAAYARLVLKLRNFRATPALKPEKSLQESPDFVV
jgi:hypothetical protein